jgi:hypothetical protein
VKEKQRTGKRGKRRMEKGKEAGGGWYLGRKNVYILMDLPNDLERSWIVGCHFDSTV